MAMSEFRRLRQKRQSATDLSEEESSTEEFVHYSTEDTEDQYPKEELPYGGSGTVKRRRLDSFDNKLGNR